MVLAVLPFINIGWNLYPVKVNENFATDLSGTKNSVLKPGDLLLFVLVLPLFLVLFLNIICALSLRFIKFYTFFPCGPNYGVPYINLKYIFHSD